MTSSAPYEALVASLKSLRERVVGVNETVISTSDGLLVAADTVAVQPESVAALAAASLGLGRRTAAEVGLGGLRDVVTRCNGGYVVVLAVGDHALLVILADEGLDLPGLHRESRATVDRLLSLLGAAA
ncbi:MULTISPECIES: roadblock/LC7 domain-containing protein [unclassified Streptomyces]|uniref:roadblock/LC7 domain-containing protein n=1 Tax=unclassified Streptomyces TaxID=2593676 RepID=UPI002E2809C5|nr:roadblock/LC7 domain-containing protein [Streptomyces sp. NBC_00223]